MANGVYSGVVSATGLLNGDTISTGTTTDAGTALVNIGTYTGSQLESPSLTVLDNSGPLKPGDLLYYGTGTAHHVAVYVAPGIIINAPESGLPVELGTRATALGPDPIDALIRGRRLE